MSKGKASRVFIADEISCAASWDEFVRLVIGPRLAGEPKERQHLQSLALAAAALRAAGEHTLAANLLDEAAAGVDHV
jgi:hypothetical protein